MGLPFGLYDGYAKGGIAVEHRTLDLELIVSFGLAGGAVNVQNFAFMTTRRRRSDWSPECSDRVAPRLWLRWSTPILPSKCPSCAANGIHIC